MASKKSKILAMALCASVMTGIYAAPVMAAELEVELDGQGIVTAGSNVTGTLTIAGTDIATALTDTNLTLNSVKANTIGNTGDNFFVGVDGNVIANSVTTTGDVVAGTYSLKDIGVRTQNMTATEGNTAFTGNVSATGTLTAGDTTLANTTVGGTLDVTGETTVESLDVTKNATVGGTLNVAGDTTLANTKVGGTLNVTDKLTANNGLKVTNGTETDTLTVTGAAKVDSLEVANSATVGDKLTVGNGLDVTGNALLNNDLTVNGATKLNGVVTVGGEAKFNEKATFNGKAIFNENIDVNGFANLNSGANVNGELTVNGATKVNDDLTVNGDTKLNGNLDVGPGNFKVDTAGNTKINGDLNIGHGAFEVTAADGSFSAARDKFNVFADGSFNAASENFKVSADGVINADSLYLQTYGGGTLEVGEALQALTDAKLPDKVGGIERDPEAAGDPGDGTTTIEGMAEFDSEGMTIGDTVVNDGKITVGAAGNQTVIEGGAITTNTINAGGTIIDYVGMTVGSTVVNDSKITVGAADDQTIIEGGAITAKSLVLGTKDVGATIAGIERETVTDEFGTVNTTTIEGALKVSNNGLISNADGSFTVDSNGGLVAGSGKFAANITGITMKAPVQMTLQGDYNYKGQSVIDLGTTISDIDDRLDVLEDKTQNIKPGTGEGGASGLTGGEDTITVPDTAPGHTGITGDVTVGGEINAGEIVVGDKGSDNKTTIDGGNITTGATTIDGEGIDTVNGNFTGNITAGTGNIGDIGMAGDTITTGETTIDGEGIDTVNGNFTGNITADTGNIGDIGMAGDTINTGNTTIDGNGMTVGEGTDIKNGNITVKGDEGKVEIGKGDVTIYDENGEKVTSIQHNYDEINRVEEKFDGEVNRLDNRISKVEDRIDKVGAMSAAIANLRTMGYDPAAPTEIAVGVGQYRSETGVALGMFHYPNKDFMLSLSVSTSGDEVMGGIGATWKFGRKSPEKVLAAEKEKAAKAKLAKAEAMKKAAKEAKIKAQQERHAKLAAERAAQAEAAK